MMCDTTNQPNTNVLPWKLADYHRHNLQTIVWDKDYMKKYVQFFKTDLCSTAATKNPFEAKSAQNDE